MSDLPARTGSPKTTSGEDRRARADRLAFGAAIGGQLLCAWTTGLVVVADSLDPDLRLILGYPTLLLWLFPASIGHLGLLV